MSAEKLLKSARALCKGSTLGKRRAIWSVIGGEFRFDTLDQSVTVFIDNPQGFAAGDEASRGLDALELSAITAPGWQEVESVEHPNFSPEDAAEGQVFVPASLWLEKIKFVSLATDPDATRYALAGVLFDGDFAVATDGRRLHRCELPQGQFALSSVNIVPALAVEQVCTLIKLFRVPGVFVQFLRDSVLISCERFKFTSRLIEGRFPNWSQVVPDYATERVERVSIPVGIVDTCKIEEKRVAIQNKSVPKSGELDTAKVVVGNVNTVCWQRLNAQYLREAVAGQIGKSKLIVADVPKSEGIPVTIRGEGSLAVIVPFAKGDKERNKPLYAPVEPQPQPQPQPEPVSDQFDSIWEARLER